jgi:hypothetical protein
MTNRKAVAAPRRGLKPWDTGQILDHFVSGFEWTIPTRLELLDFRFQEQFPGELDAHRMLHFSVAPPLGRVHTGPGLLEDFLKLESASDEAILAYARRWGPLWLCPAHSLPWQHDPACEPSVSDWQPKEDEIDLADEKNDLLSPEEEVVELTDEDYARLSLEEPSEDNSKTWYDELLSGWREVSRQARATVRLARRLHDGRAGDQADWDALPFLQEILVKLVVPAVRDPFAILSDFPRSVDLENVDADNAGSDQNVNAADDPEESSDPSGEWYWRQLEALGRRQMAESVEFQRQLLAEVLNHWLELAGVRPRLNWSAVKAAVQLGGHGLIGALAVQLLFDCSRTDGLAVCTSCGTPFMPGPRRPRRDRNIYCSDCGLKAASRDAAARYRQTQKYRETYLKWFQEKRSRPAE